MILNTGGVDYYIYTTTAPLMILWDETPLMAVFSFFLVIISVPKFVPPFSHNTRISQWADEMQERRYSREKKGKNSAWASV